MVRIPWYEQSYCILDELQSICRETAEKVLWKLASSCEGVCCLINAPSMIGSKPEVLTEDERNTELNSRLMLAATSLAQRSDNAELVTNANQG